MSLQILVSGPDAEVVLAVASNVALEHNLPIISTTSYKLPNRYVLAYTPSTVSQYRLLSELGFQPDYLFVIATRDDFRFHEIVGRLNGWYDDGVTSFFDQQLVQLCNKINSSILS